MSLLVRSAFFRVHFFFFGCLLCESLAPLHFDKISSPFLYDTWAQKFYLGQTSWRPKDAIDAHAKNMRNFDRFSPPEPKNIILFYLSLIHIRYCIRKARYIHRFRDNKTVSKRPLVFLEGNVNIAFSKFSSCSDK